MNKPEKVLIIGSGPIQIGQAAEFDYSGSQACLSLKEEGIKTILVNNNPATIQTDTNIADVVYLEPITVSNVEKVIAKEKPDSIMPGMGGQMGLNMAVNLYEAGILKKHNVEVLGTPISAIKEGEGRKEFAALMDRINEPIAKSKSVTSLHEAQEALYDIDFPVIVRPGYTLGGTGGGFAENPEEFQKVVRRALNRSMNGEALIEESLKGWKEIEYEVMRDRNDNCITVCSMENFDPMGVHTGDSIVVAPTQTLNDEEYQILRSASLKIIRALGVEGGCNVQLALHPERLEYRVIEVNPRVSRSSALASKATGYPIARVSAKIGIGKTLDEIPNEVTKSTTSAFEPTIDYIVTKIPRWPFDKFRGLSHDIGTEMKGTGEVMSIGRTFEESLQKAVRSLDIKRMGMCADKRKETKDKQKLIELIKTPTDTRIFHVFDALKNGFSVDEVFEITKIDRFFLYKIKNLVEMEKKLKKNRLDKRLMKEAKRFGFSDSQLARLQKKKEIEITKLRKKLGVTPSYKLVDTCAAEFEAKTPYYYSTYEDECEVNPETDKKKLIILGSGPIRIGQGVEFDYCTVHAVIALRELGYEVLVINNNPETVSTDFDTSDKLYFEPLTVEDVVSIVEKEKPGLMGVLVQFGGQTAINISDGLEKQGVNILGTPPASIDLAENRDKFGKILEKLKIKAPDWGTAFSYKEAVKIANRVGYPVLVRPSYVLGGRAMEIVSSDSELETYMTEAVEVSPEHPILIDKFLSNAVEIDVDAVCDGKDVYIGGVMEHIEEAGVHSGDSACVIPTQTIPKKIVEEIKKHTKDIAIALNTIGLINIQYAIKDGKVYILEANPRSSRTIPFVSKATGVPLAKIASRVIMGEKLKDLIKDWDRAEKVKHVSVKDVVLPFDKLRIDPLLGPEMKSTGESMGVGKDFSEAFYKAEEGADLKLPLKGNVFISVSHKDREQMFPIASELSKLGFSLYCTEGNYNYLSKKGVKTEKVLKISDGHPNIVDMIEGKNINLIVCTKGDDPQERADGREMRFKALDCNVPFITTLTGASAAVKAIKAAKKQKFGVKSINEYNA